MRVECTNCTAMCDDAEDWNRRHDTTMTWTRDRPAQPDRYWLRIDTPDGPYDDIVRIIDVGGGRLFPARGGFLDWPDPETSWWSGPIPKPLEAKP